MNLLWIGKSCPNKLKSGGDIRALKILEILRKEYEIDVIARSADYGDSDIKAIGCTSRLTRDIRSEIEIVIKEKCPEIVILSHWTIAEEFLELVKSLTSAKIIIDSIDIEFLRLARKFEFDGLNEGHIFLKQRELAIYKKADSIIVASEPDQKELLANGDFKTIMLPCIYEINKNYQLNDSRNSYIICNWMHIPNKISTVFLCQEVIPNIETKFHIVGKHPPQQIIDFASEKIEIRGCEYEITKFLNTMNVLLCPIFYGAGINCKIAEALCFGIPVVTSALGAIPFGLNHREHCMIAENTKESFVKNTNEVFNNKELRETLSKNGRDLMKSYTIEYWQNRLIKDLRN